MANPKNPNAQTSIDAPGHTVPATPAGLPGEHPLIAATRELISAVDSYAFANREFERAADLLRGIKENRDRALAALRKAEADCEQVKRDIGVQ